MGWLQDFVQCFGGPMNWYICNQSDYYIVWAPYVQAEDGEKRVFEKLCKVIGPNKRIRLYYSDYCPLQNSWEGEVFIDVYPDPKPVSSTDPSCATLKLSTIVGITLLVQYKRGGSVSITRNSSSY